MQSIMDNTGDYYTCVVYLKTYSIENMASLGNNQNINSIKYI